MTGNAQPSDRDLDAIGEMQEFLKRELPQVRGRADKWVTGITAITGVITTAALIKGPDTLDAISDRNLWWFVDPRLLTVALLVLGGIGLAFGLYKGFSAANGTPLRLDDIAKLSHEPSARTVGAAVAWNEAVRRSTRKARAALRTAVLSTFAGMVVLVAAVIYAGFAPAADQAKSSFCVTLQTRNLLSGTGGGTAQVTPCTSRGGG